MPDGRSSIYICIYDNQFCALLFRFPVEYIVFFYVRELVHLGVHKQITIHSRGTSQPGFQIIKPFSVLYPYNSTVGKRKEY
jgi:hypothetical protein